jgi:hypothetical protein
MAAVPATLAAAVALVLPTPENVAVFLGALGLGLGLGVGFYIERVGKAKVKAFKEYDAAFKGRAWPAPGRPSGSATRCWPRSRPTATSSDSFGPNSPRSRRRRRRR